MVTYLEDIGRAAGDELLVERIASAAAEAGINNPEGWARLNARRVVATPITPEGETPASVFAYAVATYQPAPRPGENRAAVTDDYLRAAVAAVRTAQQP